MCNWNITDSNMKYITCPHEKYDCGISKPNIGLSLNQSVTLELSRYFNTKSSCYYELTANDQVALEDLDPYNRKYI